MKHIVYGLFDPREPQSIRYVGFSSDMDARLYGHVYEAEHSPDNTHKLNWIRTLLGSGVRPGWRELDTANSKKEAGQKEKDIIRLLRALGADLTNSTDGGDGTALWTPKMRLKRSELSARYWRDAANRDKQRRAMEAFWKTPEGQATREKTRIGNQKHVGQKRTAETKAKMRAAKLGKPHARQRTPEWNAKIAASNRGKKHRPMTAEQIARKNAKMASPETRAKMSAAATLRWTVGPNPANAWRRKPAAEKWSLPDNANDTNTE
jgi:NUMOD3 motif